MLSIEQEIASWSATRPTWQQEILHRLAAGQTYSEHEIRSLAAQITTAAPKHVAPLKAAQVPGTRSAGATITLRSIRDATNVNALLDGQILTFAPAGLTVVYGDNGSGKSGYARLLKAAVAARHQQPVHANVFSDTATQLQHAEIEYATAGQPKAATWPASVDPELHAVSFYDESCGDTYIGGDSELTYRPPALAMLDGLIVVCDAVRLVLNEQLRDNAIARGNLPPVSGGTKAGRFLAALSAQTTKADLDAACSLPGNPTQELGAHIQEEARLRATDPARERQRLEELATKIESVSEHLADVAGRLSDETAAEARTAQARAVDLRTAAGIASSATFDAEPLHGVGGEAWRALWDAARRFSEADAYHAQRFPVTGWQSRCVLCQQQLDIDAADRMERFHRFMQDTTAQEADNAEQHAASLTTALHTTAIKPASIAASLAEISQTDPELSAAANTWLDSAATLRAELLDQLTGKDPAQPSSLGLAPRTALDARVTELREAAAHVDATQFQTTLSEAVANRNELEARIALAASRPAMDAEITRLRERGQLEDAKRSTDTSVITRKASELTEAYVTSLVRDRFTRESDRLYLEHIELKKTGGQKGKLRHRPALLGARVSKPISEVLSEGEQTALGLAGYFTEAFFDDSKSALVLDDPMTSLDHIRRSRVARRLAELAEDRQVIVFTHDVAFVGDLRRAADERQVPFTERGVTRRGDKTPGVCTDQHPWKAKDVPRRFDELAQGLARINRERPTWGQDTYEKECADWAGKLSETWERLINLEIVHQVVDPGTSEVRPKMFRVLVHITDADDREFQQNYSRISAWARRHDKSPVANYVAPEPSELQTELNTVKAWFDRVKKYRSN